MEQRVFPTEEPTLLPVWILCKRHINLATNKQKIFSFHNIVLQTIQIKQWTGVCWIILHWDIGPEGANNYVGFDNTYGYGFCYNVKTDSLPVIGVQLLSDHDLNFAAIDNEASIYNGFTLEEKWNVLTRGVWYRNSPIGDASMVIGTGKFTLAPQESNNVSFAIARSGKIADLSKLLANAQSIAKDKGIASGFQWAAIPKESSIEAVYPNPTQRQFVHNIT